MHADLELAKLQSLIQHVSDKPSSFALVHAPPGWPFSSSDRNTTDSAGPEGEGRYPSCPAGGDRAVSLAKRDATYHKADLTLLLLSRAGAILGAISAVNIAILDSSFNPPTLAHHAIALSSFPSPYVPRSASADVAASASGSGSSSSADARAVASPPYTARLLLFSARNVEKVQKESDATPIQRVQMMILQAKAMAAGQRQSRSEHNIAVGLINDPTFVGKAHIIRDWLRHQRTCEREERKGKIDLTFLVGTDTLVRVFDPRFYPSSSADGEGGEGTGRDGVMQSLLERFFRPSGRQRRGIAGDTTDTDIGGGEEEGQGAYLVSARRGTTSADRALEEEILSRQGVRQFVDSGRVRLLGDGAEGWEEMSSTRVRDAVKARAAGGTGGGGEGEDLRDLVGDDIARFIEDQRLYV